VCFPSAAISRALSPSPPSLSRVFPPRPPPTAAIALSPPRPPAPFVSLAPLFVYLSSSRARYTLSRFTYPTIEWSTLFIHSAPYGAIRSERESARKSKADSARVFGPLKIQTSGRSNKHARESAIERVDPREHPGGNSRRDPLACPQRVMTFRQACLRGLRPLTIAAAFIMTVLL